MYQNRPYQRQMFDVSAMGLKCAECGADIKELPFQPSIDPETNQPRPVYCRECNAKRRRNFSSRRRF